MATKAEMDALQVLLDEANAVIEKWEALAKGAIEKMGLQEFPDLDFELEKFKVEMGHVEGETEDELVEALITRIGSIEVFTKELLTLKTAEAVLDQKTLTYSGNPDALIEYIAGVVLGAENVENFLSIEDAHEASEVLAQAVDALVALEGSAKEYDVLEADIDEIKEILCPQSYIDNAGKQIRKTLTASAVKGQNQTVLEIKSLLKSSDIPIIEATYSACAEAIRLYADKHENVISEAERGKLVLNFNVREFKAIEGEKK